jgi:hypothetical protein
MIKHVKRDVKESISICGEKLNELSLLISFKSIDNLYLTCKHEPRSNCCKNCLNIIINILRDN